ncbi:MAG: heat shock protein HtpX, partial [Cryptosporangiaceae bacterium]|nr:heat shock protein HtpX [Cryptosporangiaceae bacterium]
MALACENPAVSIETAPKAECPECQSALRERADVHPWCPECGWQEAGVPGGLIARRAARVARRLALREFAALRGRPVDKPGRNAVRIGAYALAGLVHLGIFAVFGAGVWVISTSYPWPVGIGFGALLMLVAVLLRPRLGKPDPCARELTPDRHPALFRLVNKVAAELGAPAPHRILVNDRCNAYYAVLGLRRRRILTIGAPLWMILPPQQRVALVGHELGHGINGDSRHGLVVGSALRAIVVLRDGLQARGGSRHGLLVRAGAQLGEVAQAIGFALVTSVGYVLALLVARSSQRAEYLADELAARVASSRGAEALFDTLGALDTCAFRMQVATRRTTDWREVAAAATSLFPLPADE